MSPGRVCPRRCPGTDTSLVVKENGVVRKGGVWVVYEYKIYFCDTNDMFTTKYCSVGRREVDLPQGFESNIFLNPTMMIEDQFTV